MPAEKSGFDEYVETGILNNNTFNIAGVFDLKSMNSLLFDQDEYKKIKSLISAKDVEGIKAFRNTVERNGEYLEIMTFHDQNGNLYLVTVYDSDVIWQDPQVIEIFKL